MGEPRRSLLGKGCSAIDARQIRCLRPPLIAPTCFAESCLHGGGGCRVLYPAVALWVRG